MRMRVRFEPTEPFVPITGASGPHAQTILASFLRVPPLPRAQRRQWETPDGDFLVADQILASPDHPHVLVLHGLEGSSRAGYVRETMHAAVSRGFGVTALNFRSCSGEPNRKLRAYNSGDITDACFVIDQLRAEGLKGPLFGVGFSLGGSVLLNLLAKTGENCPLDGGVAISVPFDLGRCATLLDERGRLTGVYRRVFLASLKAKTLARCRQFPGELDEEAIRRARGIREFDDAVTAPLFGFRNADDYYATCSTAGQLHAIRRPTLLITAEDDPLAPASMLPEGARQNPALCILRTARGGHVGFMSGAPGAPKFWAETQAMAFLEQVRRAAPTKN